MTRPLSYHPAVPVYSNSSSSSAGIGFGSPLSSSGTVAMPYPGRQIIDPLVGSSTYSHKNAANFPSPLVSGQHHRPPSAQSNRRNKAISQYEPVYDDVAFPRATPATVVKQHHPTHLAFVTPVRQATGSPRHHQLDFGASSSPWAPRSPTGMFPSGHQFDHPDDVSSMTSLNSPTPGPYSGTGSKSHYGRKGMGFDSFCVTWL